jgi:tetratricopeptide (TPR) repeat protein
MEHTSPSAVAFSPDGKTFLTEDYDKKGAQLWDAATSQPIGPPMPNSGSVLALAFSRDGRFLLVNDGRTTRRWAAPGPLPDDVTRLSAWVVAATGLELDEWGEVRVLNCDAWLARRKRLEELGGSPPPDPAPRLDPTLDGADPAARGDGWKERGLWDWAEAAYAEAIRAQPLNQSAWDALARFHVSRGHLDRAAATLAEAIRMMPDDLVLRRQLGAILLASGDRAGWRCSTAALLHLFGGTINPWTADQVARSCIVGPEAATESEMSLRLTEAAVTSGEVYKADALITLGAALYRAGRCDEAIGRLEEAIQTGRRDVPRAWPFLAMAHHRLGHRDEARRWLDRLRGNHPRMDPAQFWDELEILVLRSEAEAVVLHDPIFPTDPFAH